MSNLKGSLFTRFRGVKKLDRGNGKPVAVFKELIEVAVEAMAIVTNGMCNTCCNRDQIIY